MSRHDVTLWRCDGCDRLHLGPTHPNDWWPEYRAKTDGPCIVHLCGQCSDVLVEQGPIRDSHAR